jgi:hypothetical protein
MFFEPVLGSQTRTTYKKPVEVYKKRFKIRLQLTGSVLVLENEECNTFSVPPETSKVPVSFIASA